MFKKLFQIALVLLFAGIIAACSSPEEKAADYIKNAGDLFAQGDLQKAEIEYKNALQINQNLPDAWYGLAKIHERKQEWRKAYGVLSKIRELAPRHVDGRIMLGQMLLASNQIDQALQDAKEILELAPNDARSHSLMAAVQFRLGNYAGAVDEIEKSLQIEPGNHEAILVRARVLIVEEKIDQALEVLDTAIEASPDNASFYLMKIQALGSRKDKQGIEEVYLALISQFPQKPAFKQALAQQYLGDDNVDAAEGMFLQLVEADPSDVDEKLRFVVFKNQYRSVEDAIALIQTYIDQDDGEYRFRFLLAELHQNSGKSNLALEVLGKIVADAGLQPDGLEARTRIALIEMQSGGMEKAAALVDEVLGHDANNEDGLLLRAGFQLSEQKFDDAIVSARTVLRDNPDSIKALGLLGQAYAAKGSPELASESYTRAFQLSPGTAVIANELARHLIRQRNSAQADEVLLESIKKGNRSVDALVLLAQVKLALGEWDKAEQLARELQAVEGQEAVSQQMLGVVFQGKEQAEESISAFKRAHELAPTAAQPITSLVQSYVRAGKLTEARNFLNSVLSVHSDNVTAHLMLGQLSQFEKKPSEAVESYRKVIELDPNLDEGYRNLATLYIREGEIEKAEMVTKQGLETNPGRPILTINLASIYERKKEIDKAIEVYEALLDKNAGLLVARNNLASLLTDHRGDQASLVKARTLAAELRESPVPQFRDTYAWASVKAGTNLEEAIVLLKGIVDANAQVGVYNYHLGEAYRKKGDAENAKLYLKKAIELAGSDSEIATQASESLQQLGQ